VAISTNGLGDGPPLASVGVRASNLDLETRDAYDAVANAYARVVLDLSLEAPLDRAVLAAFTEMVAMDSDALVAEIGCGTGRVTRHLHKVGLRMIGFDLSPGMAAVARTAYEELPFPVAHAAALPLGAGVLGGLVAWYSLIHMPTNDLPQVFAEFARVTRPGAPVLVALQCGDGERVTRTMSYGEPVPLTYYRHRTEQVTAALEAAGFALYATVTRASALMFETTPQVALLAHRSEGP
jgi:ubiquinone/menaquinone biosynthesis C-methylase UbiE